MATEREQVITAVLTHPILEADAIVVLGGEDAEERGASAFGLFRQGVTPAGPIVCSGGIHTPPRRISGAELSTLLMAHGVSPERLLVEGASQHTGEQARNVVELAVANDWHRVVVVASNYHIVRAFLAFVKAIGDRPIHVIPFATSHLSWWKAPPGVEWTRLELLGFEFDKCAQHADDCATWSDALAYLKRWDCGR